MRSSGAPKFLSDPRPVVSELGSAENLGKFAHGRFFAYKSNIHVAKRAKF